MAKIVRKKNYYCCKLGFLMTLCYLQSYCPFHGLPKFLQIALWSIYVAEIFVLSCRLFGIRVATLSRLIRKIGGLA